MLDAHTIETYGRVVDYPGPACTSYLVGGTVYTVDYMDVEPVIDERPANGEDYINAGVLRRLPISREPAIDYEGSLITDRFGVE